jgi:GNAT superfamily N-acetyltransferase
VIQSVLVKGAVMNETFAQLIRELRAHLEMPDMPGDDSQECGLEVDGTLVIFVPDEPAQAMALYSDLGVLPQAQRENVMEALLRANFGWHQTRGATLAVEGDTQTVALMRRIPLQGLQSQTLLTIVEDFLGVARQWEEVLGSAGSEGAGAQGGGGSATVHMPPPSGMA